MESHALEEKSQDLFLYGRGRAVLTGVTEILRFDETCIVLDTLSGKMTLEGDGLKMTEYLMQKGEVQITGKVYAVLYAEEKKQGKKGGISALWR